MGYGNTNHFIIIGADDRDPDVSWTHHRQRGSVGGTDNVAPYGTRLKPPTKVRIENIPWNGTGGHTVRMHHVEDPNRFDEYMHVSEFLLPNGAIADVDDYVAKSGASGPGKDLWYYDPHVHWHLYIAGVRVNPYHYFETDYAAVTVAAALIKEILIMADLSLQAIEQNGTPNMAETGSVGIYGGGVRNGFVQLTPEQRPVWNTFRSVINQASVNQGGGIIFPKPDAAPVDAYGWDAVRRIFDANYAA